MPTELKIVNTNKVSKVCLENPQWARDGLYSTYKPVFQTLKRRFKDSSAIAQKVTCVQENGHRNFTGEDEISIAGPDT